MLMRYLLALHFVRHSVITSVSERTNLMIVKVCDPMLRNLFRIIIVVALIGD